MPHPAIRPSVCRALAITLVLAVATADTAIAQAPEHVRHRTFYHGQWLDYFERDGLAVFDGDIILGTAAQMREIADSPPLARAVSVGRTANLWPLGASGVHEVPYAYTGTNQKALVDEAIASFNATFAGVIRWVPRTSQSDYVRIDASSPGCSSAVGRNGGPQPLTAGSCNAVGSALHEMGHTAGLWHTQQAADRAAFIDAFIDPRDPLSRIVPTAALFGGYDYQSIMHYGATGIPPTGDLLRLATKPSGIDVGQSAGYSSGDIDIIKRLYGAASSHTTVDSNPPGLVVLVDGQPITTPAVFSWPLGSTHTLDVPPGVQAKDSFQFGFGRWSHDASANPASALTYVVVPGEGLPWEPSSAPKYGVLIANFVRLIKAEIISIGAGQLTVTPDVPPWPGTSDLYPQWTAFNLAAQAAPGGTTQWYSTGYAVSGTAGESATMRVRLSGDASNRLRDYSYQSTQRFGADFTHAAGVTLEANRGRRGPIVVTPTGGPSYTTGLPNVLGPKNTAGSTLNVRGMDYVNSGSYREVHTGVTGLDDALGNVAIPPSGFRKVVFAIEGQYMPVVQALPACGGSVALSTSATWIPEDTTLTATATPTGSARFAGWGGTVSGMAAKVTSTATEVPEFVAYFNSIAEPLALDGIAPADYMLGQGSVTFELKGTGFTPQAFALVGSKSIPVQYIDPHTVRVTLGDSELQPSGIATIYIGQTISNGCAASSDVQLIKVRSPVALTTGGMVLSNPYGPLQVTGGSLTGDTFTLIGNAAIQLGSTPGAAGSYAELDLRQFDIPGGASLVVRSGAKGQAVRVSVSGAQPTTIAGTLRTEGANGAPAPALYLHNPNGIAVAAGGAVAAPTGLVVDTLGASWSEGAPLLNAGTIDGGISLQLRSASVNGGGMFKGDAMVLSTLGNANNPVNGAHFLSNSLQLFPSTASTVALTVNHYGAAPQFLNLAVNGNATVSMPTAWPAGSVLPRNNAPVGFAMARAAGTPEPGYGGGSLIMQATGSLDLFGGVSGDFAFPGGIVLRAGAALRLNGVLVNQGWTTTGRAFQGVFFESPSIGNSPGNIRVLSNDLNWINFSTLPQAPVRTWTLRSAAGGSAEYVAADAFAPHVNTYSTVVEAAANGQCWVCLIDPAPVDVY